MTDSITLAEIEEAFNKPLPPTSAPVPRACRSNGMVPKVLAVFESDDYLNEDPVLVELTRRLANPEQ